MPVLKPRNRLVYFRVSEDEYQRLNEACQQHGARCISEVARRAVNNLLGHGSAEGESTAVELASRLRELAERIEHLGQRVQHFETVLLDNKKAMIVDEGVARENA